MLRFQHHNGGFCHPPFTAPNVEETAFALMAMKAALRSKDEHFDRQKVYQAAVKAEQFIKDRWDRRGKWTLESWKGRLPQTMNYLTEAVILSSLY